MAEGPKVNFKYITRSEAPVDNEVGTLYFMDASAIYIGVKDKIPHCIFKGSSYMPYDSSAFLWRQGEGTDSVTQVISAAKALGENSIIAANNAIEKTYAGTYTITNYNPSTGVYNITPDPTDDLEAGDIVKITIRDVAYFAKIRRIMQLPVLEGSPTYRIYLDGFTTSIAEIRTILTKAADIAYGACSGFFGNGNVVAGTTSYVLGLDLTARNDGEFAVGVLNKSNATYQSNAGRTTRFSVGIGDYIENSGDSSVPRNALEIMQNGDIYVYGAGDYDGTTVANSSTLQDLLNKEAGQIGMISVTYDELVDLVNSSSLLPGMQYRMTDYDTKISKQGVDSMHHRFDLVLTALSENSLSENCGAVQHEFSAEELQGISADEAHYFDGCNLDAWQIKYSIDNDTDRFDWVYSGRNKEAVLAPLYFSSFDSLTRFTRDLSSDSSVSMNGEHWGNFIYAFTDQYDEEYYFFDTSVLDGYNLCYYGYNSGYAPANCGYVTFTPSGFMSFDSDKIPASESFSKDQFSFRITPTGDSAFNYVAFSRDERYDNLYAAQGYDTASGWYAYSYTKTINDGFSTISFNFVIWHNDSSVDDLVEISLTDGDESIFYKEPSAVKITYPPYARRTAVIDGETVSMDIIYPEDSHGFIALCAEDTNDLDTWGIKNMPFGFDPRDASMHVYEYWGNSLYASSGYITEFREYTSADVSSMISKGVIYDMTDEYGNNMPYDFKNIVYKVRDENWGDVMVYTFSRIDASSGIVYDATLKPMDINITV